MSVNLSIDVLRRFFEPERRQVKRNAVRGKYRDLIQVAYVNDDGTKSEFYDAQGRDISIAGISFYTRHEPPGEAVELILGLDDPLRMEGRIVHFTDVPNPAGTRYLIGCEFTRQL